MKVGLVCSQGGHLTEMMEMLEAFQEYALFFATYTGPREAELKAIAPTYVTPYTGVGPLSTLRYFTWALRLLLKERPDVIVSNGAEIALPFFYLGKLMGTKLVYIEGLFSVTRLSKTGKLVYPVADLFLVQWPQLLESCGKKARYEGSIL
jgi:UDP-N-acetylglucosamine:LPS N-acetylglucosamine transferase